MQILVLLSDFIIPFTCLYIVFYGMIKKIAVYDSFVRGAKDGMVTVAGILPTLVGLMVSVGVLRASGFLDFLCAQLENVAKIMHFPKELIPLSIVRLFSSSAATGLALDIFKSYGTDSKIGLIASVMMGCTETVFYTMSVYFMTAGVKKSRWTLPGALLCTGVGIAISAAIGGML